MSALRKAVRLRNPLRINYLLAYTVSALFKSAFGSMGELVDPTDLKSVVQ